MLGADICPPRHTESGVVVLGPFSLLSKSRLSSALSCKRIPHYGPHFLFYLSDCELKLGKLASCVLALSPGKPMKDDRYCEFSPHSHCEGNEKGSSCGEPAHLKREALSQAPWVPSLTPREALTHQSGK